MDSKGYKTFGDNESQTQQRQLGANPLSKLFFWWVVPIIRTGYKTELKVSDFDDTVTEDGVEYLSGQVQKHWKTEMRKGRPSLLRASVRTFWKDLLLSLLTFVGSQVVLKMMSPIILGFLLRNLSNENPDHTFGALFAALFLICIFTGTLLYHHGVKRIQHTGSKARIAFTGLLGQKMLRLDQGAVAKTGIAELINIITTDMIRFDRGVEFTSYLIIVPLQFITAMVIVWHYLGPSTLAAVILVCAIMMYQVCLGSTFAKIRLNVAMWTGQRIRRISELLNGLQIIKQFTWESLYITSITETRNLEIAEVKRRVIRQATNASIFEINAKVMVLATFFLYILAGGGNLASENVFVVLSIFNSLSVSLGVQFPIGSLYFADVQVSFRRIQEFLVLEERNIVDRQGSNLSNMTVPISPVCVEVVNLSIRWPNSDNAVFSDVSFSAAMNQLTVIVGPVGSGKSTLVLALLSELKPESGIVELCGSIAYSPQEAWLTTDTIRENILFGREYDHHWYNTVVDACALSDDFEALQFGDLTNVADKGSNLSGGQKARINLARACYSRADIYLLDDPISAVDTIVARHLLDNCIQGLLKSKCVVLVTHQTHLLPSTSNIISLGNEADIFENSVPDFSIDALESELNTSSPTERDEKLSELIREDKIKLL